MKMLIKRLMLYCKQNKSEKEVVYMNIDKFTQKSVEGCPEL